MMKNWQQIQSLAMDIDGTLTTNKLFTPQVLSALHRLKAAGIKLILVTGRPSGWVQGLASYFPVDAAIAENGGVVFRGPEAHPCLRDPSSDSYMPASGQHHREALASVFSHLQRKHPGVALHETEDNVFRLSDFTFHVAGLSNETLTTLKADVEAQGFGFTWSTIHAHIMPRGQNKGSALNWLLHSMGIATHPASTTLTVGDSPNDAPLFEEALFPFSVGVANIEKYRNAMPFFPKELSRKSEGEGFVEIAEQLLSLKGGSQ